MSESQHRRGDAQDRTGVRQTRPSGTRQTRPSGANGSRPSHPLPETRKNAESAERNARSTAESGRFC